jgi:hypothetical protein
MKIADNIGLNPEVWKDKTKEEFTELCKGKISPSEIEQKWVEFKKLYPSTKKKPSKAKVEDKEGAE